MKPTLDFVNQIAVNAGDILKNFKREDLDIAHKSSRDLVTQADYASERYLIDAIQQVFPGHAIIAEESGESGGSKEHQWFIDPLDGTLNYAHGVPFYAVSIGYAYRGELTLGVVYDPERGELFSAQRGSGATLNGAPLQVSQYTELVDCMLVTGFPQEADNSQDDNAANFIRFNTQAQTVRRLGSAALDMVYVAAGRLDGFWQVSIGQWDIAAGCLIVQEAGGVVTDLYGGPDYLQTPSTVVCANPVIHQKMLEVLAAVRAERGVA
ncbi:MAG TPA: inositol monophosphatase family protein [Brevefilum sp.]|nr:inositol monophosphatase family protein [Brevefilum sp.]HOR19322.1 inositol monophosphatase family protein [Brevefilum sp.]HPL69927.1 inositol monophosphatase family protein [Brevefilum sp.]